MPTLPMYLEAKRQWLIQLVGDAHRSWIDREGFVPLYRVVEELRDYSGPWHICGGWAFDLFLGGVTRGHHDVDVQVPRAYQLALREYLTARGWRLLAPCDGELLPWPKHMLLELPRHQVHAHRNGAFIDFLLADLDGSAWRYRREPVVMRDLSRIGM